MKDGHPDQGGHSNHARERAKGMKLPSVKAKPLRIVTLLSWHVEPQIGVVRVDEGKKTDLYRVERAACEFGDAFRMGKVKVEGVSYTVETTYDVNIDGHKSTCDCMGFSQYGHCRHVDSLQKLLKGEAIPQRQQGG